MADDVKMIGLKEWDDMLGPSGGFAIRMYPSAIVTDFVEWLRNTRQWRESPEQVYHRWLKMERDLTDARNAETMARVAVPEPIPEPVAVPKVRAKKKVRRRKAAPV